METAWKEYQKSLSNLIGQSIFRISCMIPTGYQEIIPNCTFKMCFGENLNFPCRVLGWNITELKGERVEEEAHLRLRNERTGSTRREQRARLKHTEQAEISIRKERQKDSSCLPPERKGWRKREASSAVEKQGGATGEGWESEGKYRARGEKKINGNTW